ncbi:roundabout homolog 1-like isoform X2 [Dreissena polymorpha]|uniref:roundabout homolog 1-like isoform X2 n=1 Tax=Dreissena polymorpha TaxID=45954 RepID=UPI002264DE2E|nr:roundabout homolog 1-like isoform X2 [Dreissena polymorpha]
MFGIIFCVFFIWIKGVFISSSDGVVLTLTPCQRVCTVIAGSAFNITCQRTDAALAWFTWSLENGHTRDSSNALTKTQASPTKGVNSTLSFFPERKHHDWNLYCSVYTIEDERHSYSEKTRLQVLYGPDKPIFKVGVQYMNSTTVNIIEGKNISVECCGNSNPLAAVTWYNTRSQTNGAWLNFTNISRNSDGIFTCTLENQMKASDNNERYGRNESDLNLEILTPPTAPTISYSGNHILKSINIIEGKDYDFYCTSSGKPSPQIDWKLLNSTTEHDVLQIRKVGALHNTTITCCAKNHMIPAVGVPEHGLECTHLNLNVLHKPTFAFNDTYDVKENDSFNVTCTQQNMNTVVTWVRQGDDKWSESNNTIYWTDVRREQSGNYTCKLRYSITDSFKNFSSGDSEHSFHLNVEYPASVITFEAVRHSDSIVVNEKESVTFRCNATGNPSPKIQIKNTNRVQKQRNAVSLRYTENMTCTHTGKYSCYARNIINEEESKSKDIDVVVKCSPRPASNMPSELNFTTTLHSIVVLNFTVIAYPEPQPSDYVWKKCDVEESNGHLQCFPLVDEGHFNVSIVDLTSYLTISDFIQHDIGRYVLTVQNGVGNAWNQTFLVVIKDKPEAPLLFYESTAPHSVILKTTAGYSGGISQSIILLYKNIHASEWIKVDAISDVPTNYTFSCTLTGLDSNMNYSAMTYASNELGNSTTVSIYFTLAVLEKSYKPEAPLLFYESTAPHSVILTTTAGYSGGISQSIILLYKNIHASEWIKVDAISDVPTNYTFSCTLTGLDSNINYTAITYASNELGNSTTVSIYFTPAVLEKISLTYSLAGGGIGLLVCIVVAFVVYKFKCRHHSGVIKIKADRDEVVENPMYIPAGDSFLYQVSRIIPELPHPSADDATIYSSPYSYGKEAPYDAEKNVSENIYHNVYDDVQCGEFEEDEFWSDFSDEDCEVNPSEVGQSVSTL